MNKIIISTLLLVISLNVWGRRIVSSNVYCDPIAISTDHKKHYILNINKDGNFSEKGNEYNYYLTPKYPGIPECNIEIDLKISKNLLFDTIQIKEYSYMGPIETTTNIFTVKFHLKSESTLGFIPSGYNSRPTKEIDTYTLCRERRYFFN